MIITAARWSGFVFFLMLTASFSSASPVLNVFCSELSVLAAKGNSVKRCWALALSNSARILGESEHAVFMNLPSEGMYCGFISRNGVKCPAIVSFQQYNFPIVS